MDNPIVVFVVPGSFGNALTKLCHESTANDEPVAKKWAVGVTSEGIVECAKKNSEYSLLLLDDTICPPSEAPCKIDLDQPLLIVRHNNSTINKKPGNRLFNVESSVICDNFSHTEEFPVFVNIRNIVTDGAEAKKKIKEFVEKYRISSYLQALDGLAAISQIRLLIAKGESLRDEYIRFLGEERDKLFLQCPIIDKKDIDEFKSSKAAEQLRRLLEKANSLVPFSDGT